ncbi:MAG TPA: RNA pseudouridine synthase [Rectinemataceae bacterium]|nr:RNA pseudouridine synthase [Rectinemataceae bacterium]
MKHRIPPGAPGHPREDARAAKAPKGRSPRGRADRGGDKRSEAGPDDRDRRGAKRRDDLARPARRSGPPRSPAAVEFLYEDENLIAVDKPAGLPVIAPEGGRGRCLYDIVTDHIRKTNPKGRAAVVHRIDRDTSGLVVFATNAAAKKLLMAGWDEIVRERRYLALVEGEMEAPEGRRESWLVENSAGAVYEAQAKSRGAKRAATRWKVLASGRGLSLLELSLETGRKHQIRVQLAAMGHPVAGDERYGSRVDPIGRLGLHAELIELALPGARLPLRLECRAPATFRRALGGAPAASAKPAEAAAPRSTAKSRPAAPKGEKPRSKADPAAGGAGHDARKSARPSRKDGPSAPADARRASRSEARSGEPLRRGRRRAP